MHLQFFAQLSILTDICRACEDRHWCVMDGHSIQTSRLRAQKTSTQTGKTRNTELDTFNSTVGLPKVSESFKPKSNIELRIHSMTQCQPANLAKWKLNNCHLTGMQSLVCSIDRCYYLSDPVQGNAAIHSLTAFYCVWQYTVKSIGFLLYSSHVLHGQVYVMYI